MVLGAGGVLGGAWMAGGLAAIARETGWDPFTADYIVGTSAGALFAALTAGHVELDRMVPPRLAPLAGIKSPRDWLLDELASEGAYLPRRVPRPLPGSWGLAVSGLRDRTGLSLLKALSGLAPQGLVSTEPIERCVERGVGRLTPAGWVSHGNTWIVACDYQSGERVVFGREGGPVAPLPKAVAASCAIPGFFQPVRVGDRLYVDGGLHSMSNLDLLEEEELDLVVILSPLSSREARRSWNPVDQVAATLRRLAAWQLDREAARLIDRGTHVMVLEPLAEDLEAMGSNVMDARRSIDVAEVALSSFAEQLAQPEISALCELLPRTSASRRRAGKLTALLRRAGMAAAAAV
ncbi:MAG TPA: patatin-like phospholipase family protein [Candidatus Dormibacteraeota bacterium]